MRKGKELRAPRYTSAVATRDGNLPSRDGKLPYVTAICLIPDKYKVREVTYILRGIVEEFIKDFYRVII